MRARALAAVVVVLLSVSSLAEAHGPYDGVSTLQLEPVVDSDGALGVAGARTLGDDAFATGVLLSYVAAPLVLLPSEGSGAPELEMIESQIILDYMVAVAFGRRVQIGAGLPIVLSQSGDFDTIGEGPSSTAFGDVRAELKYAIVPNDPDGPGLAFAPQVIIPSGDQDSFDGEEGIAFHPRLLADFRLGSLGAFVNVGVKVRTHDGQLEELRHYSHELTWGFALSVPVPGMADFGSLLAEYRAGTQLRDPFGVAGANPAEVDGALRVLVRSIDLTLTGGGGAGLTQSIGTPDFRAFFGLSWRPTEHDDDHDGISNGDDGCPAMPEDGDGFEDSDGCPEPDNDKDGIDDGDDRCPTQAEDRDGAEDTDGCPDPDSDNDGVSDSTDRCAGELEDRDSFQDEDGCPDPDNDGDGVADASDRCVMEPEDKDEHEDADGCPDLDNDGDGKNDPDDRCAMEAEDADNFEDEDGCPEIDNDHDGVLDAADTCADRAETINGVTDEDGCPDAGAAPLARVLDGRARLPGPIRFAANGAPTPASQRMIDQLAHFLIKLHPTTIRLVSHGADAAEGAARAESIRQLLLQRGVPAASAGTVAHETGAGATNVTVE